MPHQRPFLEAVAELAERVKPALAEAALRKAGVPLDDHAALKQFCVAEALHAGEPQTGQRGRVKNDKPKRRAGRPCKPVEHSAILVAALEIEIASGATLAEARSAVCKRLDVSRDKVGKAGAQFDRHVAASGDPAFRAVMLNGATAVLSGLQLRRKPAPAPSISARSIAR